MSEVCTKCQGEPRAKGSLWGRGCLAEAAKGRRMRRGNATDATSHGDVTASHAPRETALQVARRRVEEQAEEIARLKRELAGRAVPTLDTGLAEVRQQGERDAELEKERGGDLDAGRGAVHEARPDPGGDDPPARRERGRGAAAVSARREGNDEVTPHGASCACLPCRHERAKAALARSVS